MICNWVLIYFCVMCVLGYHSGMLYLCSVHTVTSACTCVVSVGFLVHTCTCISFANCMQ